MNATLQEKKSYNRFLKAIQSMNYAINEQFYTNLLIPIFSKRVLRKIVDIMFITTKYADDLVCAAADFARILTKVMETNDNLKNFYNYCAFFEFAFTEFELNHRLQREKYLVDFNEIEPDAYLLMHHYGILMKNNNEGISDLAFNILLHEYFKHAIATLQAGLASNNWSSTRLHEANQIQEVVLKATNIEIQFASIPNAVYHWRKHTFDRVLAGYDVLPLTARQYIEEANGIINNDNHMQASFLTFKEPLDINKPGEYKFARVNKIKPIELVTYLPLKTL
jgi:hypothetical protein